jgi:hypothetical protein
MYQCYRQPNAWRHPCEAGFLTADSLWYTKWHGMTYGECKAKPNVGAWQLRQLCHVFPGPWVAGEVPPERGDCFVLDKIPVDKRCGSARTSLL